MYLDILKDNTVFLKKMKTKSFPEDQDLYVVFLSKRNLIKRNWQGSTRCCFCDHEETMQHIFIECPFAKLFGQLFTWPLTLPHLSVLIILLELG
jgi:hypothetical protein